MDVLTSGVAVAGDIMSGFWTFATSNVVISVPIFLGLVGMGIALFFSVKSRLTGRKRGKKRSK